MEPGGSAPQLNLINLNRGNSMASIVINATGFAGCFYPYLVIAKQLKANGHTVKFGTGNSNYKVLIEQHGLKYFDTFESRLITEDLKRSKRLIHPKKSLTTLLSGRVI